MKTPIFRIFTLLCLGLCAPVHSGETLTVSTRGRETPLLIKSVGGLGEFRFRSPASPSFRCEIFPSSVVKHYHLRTEKQAFDLMVETQRVLDGKQLETLLENIRLAHRDWKQKSEEAEVADEEPRVKIVAQHTYSNYNAVTREISETFILSETYSKIGVRELDSDAGRVLLKEVDRVCVPDHPFPQKEDFGFRAK